MASLWEMMAAQEDAQMNHLNEMNQQYKEKQALRDAIANRPQQTTFAEPQQAQQPQTLTGIGQGMSLSADPSLTEIQGRTGQSPEQASYEAMRRIDPAKAQEYATKVIANAHNIALMGDHEGSVNYVNQTLGTNLRYLGTKDNIMTIANGDGTHTIYDISTGKDKVIGTPKQDIEFFKNPEGMPVATGDKHTGKVTSLANLGPQSGGMPEVMRNLDVVYREPDAASAQIALGKLAEVAGVAGSKGIHDLMGTVSKQYTDKQPAKGFDTIDLGDKVEVVPRDGSASYTKKKAAKPDTVLRINNSGGGNVKPPSGYRYSADGQSLEPIPGGPADPNNSSKHGGNKQLGGPLLEGLSDQAQILKTLREAQTIASRINTGPLSGRMQSAGQFVGASSKEFNNFKQKLASANNIMLKARSGAAVTDQEYARFKQEMPTVNDDEAVRDQKLANAIGYMDELLNSKLATFQEGGYRIPDGLIARSKLGGGKTQPQRSAQPQKPKTASDYLKKIGR